MSLPLPPQLLSPQHGMVGPQQVVHSPYGATPATGVAQGIAALITGLAANKERKRQEAAQTLQTGLSLKQQGIPGVDDEKLAKAAKTLGLPLDFEAKPMQVTPQGPQQQHGPVLPGATMPTGGVQGGFPVDPAMQAVLAASQNRFATPGTVPLPQVTVPVSAQPDARAPNIMSRIGQALGLVSPTIPQSAPALEAFRELGRRGTAARQMQELGEANNTQKLGVLLAATRDLASGNRNTNNVMAAEKLKLLEAPGSVEAMQRLAVQSGIDPTSASATLFDHFSGGQQTTQFVLKEQRERMAQSADYAIKFQNQIREWLQEHPGANDNDAYIALSAMLSADPKVSAAGRKYASGFVTRTTKQDIIAEKDAKNKDIALELDAERVRQMRTRIGLEAQRVGLAARGQQIQLLELDNSIQKELVGFDRSAMDKMYSVYLNPKSSPAEKKAAANGVVHAAERMGTRKLTMSSGETMNFKFPSLKVEDVSFWGGRFGERPELVTGEGGYEDADLNVGGPLPTPNPNEPWRGIGSDFRVSLPPSPMQDVPTALKNMVTGRR